MPSTGFPNSYGWVQPLVDLLELREAARGTRCNGWVCPDRYVCDGIGKAE